MIHAGGDGWRGAMLTLAACLSCGSASAAGIETVLVTTDRPVAAPGLDATALSRSGTADILRGLDEQADGVALSNGQDNPFQPAVIYHGFQASALQGDAQGLAVYFDGTRLNQMFGEVVNWDVIPDNAISHLAVEDANPVYGLNALGGAIILHSKTGFDGDTSQATAEIASFGHYEENFQFGRSFGDTAVFLAGTKIDESGWRAHSPSHLGKLFGNVDWHIGAADIRLDVLGASNALTGNGIAPVELLAADRSAVFTYPDSTHNDYGLVSLSASLPIAVGWTLRGNIYLNALRQRTKNGDASDAEVCENAAEFLCLDDEFLTDASGTPIPAFASDSLYAQLNRTATSTTARGMTFETAWDGHIATLADAFSAGISYDQGTSGFTASSEVGRMTADRGFAGPAILISQADGSIAPVSVASHNAYLGLYFSDTISLTDALSLSAAGRFNRAEITLRDRLGSALDGDHTFTRFNPSAAISYKIFPLTVLSLHYAEANRTPSPAEFSCADPAAPCSLTNFFVGDPPLKQVVARTFSLEADGSMADDQLHWRVEAYRSNVGNEIEYVASPIIGRGYFHNVDATRRRGIDASLSYVAGAFSTTLGYSYTDATYQTEFLLSSPENPQADADGLIAVQPGDRVPNIPVHSGKAVVSYQTDGLTLSVAGRAASGRYLQGDEDNLNAPTGAYFVADATARYRLNPHFELFAGIDNLFDRDYATYGGFSPVNEVPLVEAPGATNPRSLAPAPPRRFYGGIRAQL